MECLYKTMRIEWHWEKGIKCMISSHRAFILAQEDWRLHAHDYLNNSVSSSKIFSQSNSQWNKTENLRWNRDGFLFWVYSFRYLLGHWKYTTQVSRTHLGKGLVEQWNVPSFFHGVWRPHVTLRSYDRVRQESIRNAGTLNSNTWYQIII